MVIFTPAPATAEELAHITADYLAAREFGAARLGEKYLFYSALLRLRYVAIDDIVWAYQRREEALAAAGCRRVVVPAHFLVLEPANGAKKKIRFEEDTEVKAILAELARKNPAMRVGYDEGMKQL